MPCCRVCGENKEDEEFKNVLNFTKYKKHKVIWCKDCQKLWMDMRKDKERHQKILNLGQSHIVTFD